MAELTNASDESREQGSSSVPARLHDGRRDWGVRGAVLFWIVVSAAVWIALGASAIWIY